MYGCNGMYFPFIPIVIINNYQSCVCQLKQLTHAIRCLLFCDTCFPLYKPCTFLYWEAVRTKKFLCCFHFCLKLRTIN
uniref:Uncharacterized LOC104265403 n=1 Tax=Ciona intestinalis TaxID=7719 RepID=H2XKW7_CIOIN